MGKGKGKEEGEGLNSLRSASAYKSVIVGTSLARTISISFSASKKRIKSISIVRRAKARPGTVHDFGDNGGTKHILERGFCESVVSAEHSKRIQ